MLIARLVLALVSATERPIRRITIYYLVLLAVVGALASAFPDAFASATAGPDRDLAFEAEIGALASRPPAPGLDLRPVMVVRVFVALLTALLIMVPVSWGYMSTRIRVGFDQSVVQTMLVLPIAVAGIVMVVHDSIALAFSLAGIVAAVRFRSSLSDTADALYIFLAIGVGLSCGVGALQVALVVSIFFNYVVLIFWHCDYGVCPKSGPRLGYSSGELLAMAGADASALGDGALDESKTKPKAKKGGKGRKKGKRKQALEPAGTPAAEPADALADAPGGSSEAVSSGDDAGPAAAR